MAGMRSAPKPRSTSTDRPATLTLDLFAPGMTLLHRAGLGGLACTLRYIERAYASGQLRGKDLPGGPWRDGPPWEVTHRTVRLDFGDPSSAREYLTKLFATAFRITDDLIDLPGQYETLPALAVRAELQAGLTLTFLQHGRVRTLAKQPSTVEYDLDEEGTTPNLIRTEYRECNWYKHQDGGKVLADQYGLVPDSIEVIGPLSPGAVVRHNAFPADTKIEEAADRVTCLYFALVGCLALPVNRGVGVLLIPEVNDLHQFCLVRPFLTPTSARDCRIASAADAALQAQVRLLGKRIIAAGELPGIYGMTFQPTTWASQQKSRVYTIHVPPGDEARLSQFDVAMHELPPRVASFKARETAGRGKGRKTVEREEYFWADSMVRPVVAENLALGRPWYSGFARLMTAIESRKKLVRDKVERKGLKVMTERMPWDYEGEAVLVRAVHTAIGNHLGRIRHETDGNRPLSRATKNRWDRFKERLRLSLTGAKTSEQCRNALCVLFAGSAHNPDLTKKWREVLPLLLEDWQKARDLSLLALASYGGSAGQTVETDADGRDDR